MAYPYPSSRSLAAMIVIGLAACCCSLPAQAQGATPNAGQAATAVPSACAADIVRLCPDLDMTAPDGRSAAICLKPFKTSLSVPCRKAVRAVFP